MNNCRHLYADWCHKPIRCEDYQELCIDYLSGKCPDYEDKSNEERERMKMTDKELWKKIKNNVTENDLHEWLDRYDRSDICRGYTVSMLLDVIKNDNR